MTEITKKGIIRKFDLEALIVSLRDTNIQNSTAISGINASNELVARQILRDCDNEGKFTGTTEGYDKGRLKQVTEIIYGATGWKPNQDGRITLPPYPPISLTWNEYIELGKPESIEAEERTICRKV